MHRFRNLSMVCNVSALKDLPAMAHPDAAPASQLKPHDGALGHLGYTLRNTVRRPDPGLP